MPLTDWSNQKEIGKKVPFSSWNKLNAERRKSRETTDFVQHFFNFDTWKQTFLSNTVLSISCSINMPIPRLLETSPFRNFLLHGNENRLFSYFHHKAIVMHTQKTGWFANNCKSSGFSIWGIVSSQSLCYFEYFQNRSVLGIFARLLVSLFFDITIGMFFQVLQ